MKKKSPVLLFTGSLFICGLVLLFQNCSDITLMPPNNNISMKAANIEGSFCVSQSSGGNFSLVDFMAANLTVKTLGARLYADSDMDGVADKDEGNGHTYAEFQVGKRRTLGILDGLCLQQGLLGCEVVPQSCDANTNYSTGISSCDLVNYTDVSTGKGLNTDAQDGPANADTTPDLLEILKGSDFLRADMDMDNSGNGHSNYEKIHKGWDPLSIEIPPPEKQIHLSYELFNNADPACNGNASYRFVLEAPAVVPVTEFCSKLASPECLLDADLTHDKDINVFIFYVVSASSNSTQFYKAVVRVPLQSNNSSSLSLQPADFHLEGQY